jgi:hypothetical protein
MLHICEKEERKDNKQRGYFATLSLMCFACILIKLVNEKLQRNLFVVTAFMQS